MDEAPTTRRVINDYAVYQPIGKGQIRLMQILPAESDDDDEGIVCALFDTPPSFENIVYISLSYCWGDLAQQRTISLIHHRQNEVTIQRDPSKPGDETLFEVETSAKKPFNVTESLYEALKSLRKAAPRLAKDFPILDHQPLWVDAVCINQGDLAERNSQVGMMGSIYSKAWYIFIWLGESEYVMRGLNLIEAMMKLTRDTWGADFDPLDPREEHLRTLFSAKYKVGGELLDPESCFQILDRLFAHPYFRRIWVLQEATINAESTFIHVTPAQVPWSWIIVADRFRQLWRRIFPTGQSGRLPVIWADLVRKRLVYAKSTREREGRMPRSSDGLGFSVPLYLLFVNTYEEFDATDLRDKLYALLDLSEESQRPKGTWKELEPDYSKTASQVYRDFTRFCIRRSGNLTVLSLLCSGPRKLLPSSEVVKFNEGKLLEGHLDARVHPSWVLWPTTGGYWTQSSLTRAGIHRGRQFNLTAEHRLRLFDLATHPSIKVPANIVDNFLSLAGKRMGVVKSIFRLPLRCFSAETPSFLKRRWATDAMRDDMEKHGGLHQSLFLTHPFREHTLFEGGLVPLWHYIRKDRTEATIVGEEVLEVVSQEWLGRPSGRYQGRDEMMFRDFLETLLLSPIYRGKGAAKDVGSNEMPAGPWDDPDIARSFAMYWAENDPRLEYLPPRIGQYLLSHMFNEGMPREKMFPFLFLGHGKCFFITEDERMGLCSPETQSGDVIAGLFGSNVPFVLRPVLNEAGSGCDEWTFEGHDELRNQTFRFIGECYLHERMMSSFFDDPSAGMGKTEVFSLI